MDSKRREVAPRTLSSCSQGGKAAMADSETIGKAFAEKVFAANSRNLQHAGCGRATKPRRNDMALKQREVNREALEMAAAMVENADLIELFDDLGDQSEHDDEVLSKAQAYAVRRIRSLLTSNSRDD